MKKIKLLLLACVAVFATSCGGDDDGPGFEFNQENLTGSYSITAYEVDEEETDNLGGADVTVRTTIEGDRFTNAVFAFNSNNTYSISGNYGATTVRRVNGQAAPAVETSETFNESGSYGINTDERTISLDGDVYSVSRFSSNGFTITYTEDIGVDSFEEVYILSKND